jgi:hypothetical protein
MEWSSPWLIMLGSSIRALRRKTRSSYVMMHPT